MASEMMVTRRSAMAALGLVLLPAITVAAASANCGSPADLHDGWTVAAPAAEGLDPKLICAIGPTLENMKEADPNGVVIVRHGVLVYEHYFTGKDERWPELHLSEPPRSVPHNARTLHDLQSVTKSVTAILVGIAFDHGLLKSLDVPALLFFPQYADLRTPEKNRITLSDLLSMTSGLFWPRGNGSLPGAPDPYRFVLGQPLVATPGKVWNYNTGGVAVLGAILKKVSGQPIDQFAEKALFTPLGITDWQWGRLAAGQPAASWGLRLRPRDLAKIGQLVLNHGVWRGRRIVSAGWIRQMTAPHSSLPNWISGADAYGYLWWLGHASVDSRNIPWIAGIGWGSQFLYVVPSEDLVVVATAGAYRTHNPAAGHMALAMTLRAALGH
jgi:CubicO group peptidase (beta-lactamase class C family)